MEKATPFDRLILAEVGPEKAGKSRLAATGRKPVLFFDYDRRKQSVAGVAGVYAVTITDPPEDYKQPTAFSEGLDVIAKLEKPEGTLADIDPAFPKIRPKTVVIDSMQTLGLAAMRFTLFSTPELRREINIGGKMMVMLSKGWDGWTAETSAVGNFFLRLLGIKDLDVICVFHEVAEEAPNSTDENVVLTGKIAVFPKRYRVFIKWFNELWRITREAQIPQIQVVANYQFPAATNLNIVSVDKPDISYLIEKALKK
jgi:hypothetical protein